MAGSLDERVLDFGLAVLDTEADAIFACSQKPTTFLEATVIYALGYKNFGVGAACGAPIDAIPNGRKVNTTAIIDGVVIADGDITHIAVVDTVNSRLLAETERTPVVTVFIGNEWKMGPVGIRIPGQ